MWKPSVRLDGEQSQHEQQGGEGEPICQAATSHH
jgi:hypothetical protein